MDINTQSMPTSSSTQNARGNPVALSVLASLFFMLGFITCLNDVLIPHLKEVFHLSNSEAMLTQTAFFSAYAFMSFLAGKVIDRIGYKGTVVAGFLITALGAFLFYPATGALPVTGDASKNLYFFMFLPIFFVMATGITFLQVAGNPYVTLLSPKGKESATLTLVQAFNSVATTIAPYVGALFILTDAATTMTAAQKAQTMQIPYLGLTGFLILLAGMVAKIKLPKAEEVAAEETLASNDSRTSVFQYKHMVLGALAIFFYVGAEVAIGSQYILTMDHLTNGAIDHKTGAKFLSLYWGGAMVGRFLGSAVLSRFAPNNVLLFNSLVAVSLLLLVSFFGGLGGAAVAQYGLVAIGFFNSIMFPTIFSLATIGLGRFTADASGVICTAIVGGALIPLLQGSIVTGLGDNYLISYLVPALCYAYIAYFAAQGYKPQPAPALSQ